MRRYVMMVFGILLVMSLFTGVAGADCIEIPAKQWQGTVQYSLPGPVPDITETYFFNNDCSWGDHEATFSRFDAIVFDVKSHAGLPGSFSYKKTGTLGTSVLNTSVRFIDDSCTSIPSAQWVSGQSEVETFSSVPVNARWAMATPAVGVGFANDILITVKSPGRKCPKP